MSKSDLPNIYLCIVLTISWKYNDSRGRSIIKKYNHTIDGTNDQDCEVNACNISQGTKRWDSNSWAGYPKI